jgi:hypothetical protein
MGGVIAILLLSVIACSLAGCCSSALPGSEDATTRRRRWLPTIRSKGNAVQTTGGQDQELGGVTNGIEGQRPER